MADVNDRFSWTDDDKYWQSNYRNRPYASSGSTEYEFYQPGYRYGFEAANRHEGRNWKDVESDLQKGWNSFEHRGTSTWDQMKDAVRDAWDRVTARFASTR